MEPELDDYTRRSRALDLTGIAWDEIPRHPLPAEAARCLRYMQDIESHTIMYLKDLLSTRAVDDPEVATFLACWFYEETHHGRALARFLAAAGHPVPARARSRAPLAVRAAGVATAAIAWAWPDFVAVHMTWGAINELTTLTGYRRLAQLAAHPILTELLSRIVRDESRHFQFYFRQAEARLSGPRAARVARWLVDRFWAPVGAGVQPAAETRALAKYLLAGPEGLAAARRIDTTIRRLPGFAGVQLVEAWLARELGSPGADGPRGTGRRPQVARRVRADELSGLGALGGS